jgi:hypothetical protein
MRVYSKKHPDKWINIDAKRNKILTNRNGLVMITKGNFEDSNTIEPELLFKYFIVPKNAKLKEK